MAADKTILINLELQADEANGKLTILKNHLSTLDKKSSEYKDTLKLVAKAERELSNIQQKRILAQKGLDKAILKGNDAVGASTSATLELGRVLSDMPYGIRGVANNLQQLASNLFFMSKKTDLATGKTVGFGGAINNLIGGLIGPAGLLIAFQGIVALFDFFSDKTKEASSSSSDFKEDLDSLVDTLDNLSISQADTNDKILEYIEYRVLASKIDKELKGLTEELVGLDEEIYDNKKRNSEFELRFKEKSKGVTLEQYKALSEQEKIEVRRTNQISNLTSKIEDYERSVKEVNNLEQDRVEIYNKSTEAIKRLKEERKKLTAADEDSLKGLKALKSEAEKEREVLSKTSEDYKRLTIAIDDYQKKIEEIEGKKSKSKGVKKLSPFKTPKELEIDIKNAENSIIQYQKRIEDSRLKKELNDKLSEAKTEEEKAKIRRNYEKDRLINQINTERDLLKLKKSTEKNLVETKVANHKAELERKHREFVYSVKLKEKLGEITSKQSSDLISESDKLTNKAMSQADKEAEKSLVEIREKYKPLFALFESLAGSRLDALFSKPDKNKEKEETDLERWTRYAETAKAIIGTITDFVDGEFNRQLAIEQNKTNALNNELNKRLLDENLSKDEREKIQNEIAQNDEKLRVKQEKIERKRFKMQKAANIATTLINTAVAAAGVMADSKGGFLARLSQAIPTIAFGLAQVATIARQKFQSSAGSSPTLAGGGSSGTSVRAEPSFNIVGRSNENLIANAIQSQFNQPLRAYVVARDVTNQQQLDGVISSSAST